MFKKSINNKKIKKNKKSNYKKIFNRKKYSKKPKFRLYSNKFVKYLS